MLHCSANVRNDCEGGTQEMSVAARQVEERGLISRVRDLQVVRLIDGKVRSKVDSCLIDHVFVVC